MRERWQVFKSPFSFYPKRKPHNLGKPGIRHGNRDRLPQ